MIPTPVLRVIAILAAVAMVLTVAATLFMTAPGYG